MVGNTHEGISPQDFLKFRKTMLFVLL